MSLPEREVLKRSMKILESIFKEWVNPERRNVSMHQNPRGQWIRQGKKSESDIGGWICKGVYIGKALAIEVKRGEFRPSRVYGPDQARFKRQCDYLREINRKGGVGFWVNDPRMIVHVLIPVLMHGARVNLDKNNCVTVTRMSTVKVVET